MAHVRGQIVCRNKIASGKLSGRFSKKNVPEGILHLTVFNAEEQALTERLVFVCQDTCFSKLPHSAHLQNPGHCLKWE